MFTYVVVVVIIVCFAGTVSPEAADYIMGKRKAAREKRVWEENTIVSADLDPKAKTTLISTYRPFMQSGWNEKKTVYVANSAEDIEKVSDAQFDQALVYVGKQTKALSWVRNLFIRPASLKIFTCGCADGGMLSRLDASGLVYTECYADKTLTLIHKRLSS